MNIDLKRYLPEEIPDYLFTQNKLKMMGLTAAAEHVAFVVYPEQRREFKLFDINATRERKQHKGPSLVNKSKTIIEILAERKHEIEVRKIQLGETHGK